MARNSLRKAGAIEVEGLEHAVLQLQRVNDVLGLEAIVNALLAFAREVRDRAKAHVKIGPGGSSSIVTTTSGVRIRLTKTREHLRDLIFAARGKVSNIFEPSVIMGVDTKKAPHAPLVEFGHGGPQPAGPHSFIRRAVDESRQDAERVIGGALKDALASAGLGDGAIGFTPDTTGWIG